MSQGGRHRHGLVRMGQLYPGLHISVVDQALWNLFLLTKTLYFIQETLDNFQNGFVMIHWFERIN
jgi:hypothetical protein